LSAPSVATSPQLADVCLELQPGRDYMLAIRATNTSTLSYVLGPKMGEAHRFGFRQFALGVFYGCAFLLLVFNFVVWLILRNWCYFFNVWYLASAVLSFAIFDGLLAWKEIQTTALMVGIGAASLFCIFFFDLKNKMPVARWALFGISGGAAIVFLATLLPGYRSFMTPFEQFSDLLLLVGSATIVGISVVMSRQGRWAAKWYAAGWAAIFIGIAVYLGSFYFNSTSSTLMGHFLAQVACLVQMTFISLAMADEMGHLKEQALLEAERAKYADTLKGQLVEKEILLREIHHRVKNNMTVISSLLNLQANKLSQGYLQKIFDDTQKRIMSMSLVHEHLYGATNLSSIDFEKYIQTLLREVLSSYAKDDRPVATQVRAQGIHLDLETAIPCGLILTESITNALKYAFEGRHEGLLTIALDREGSEYRLVVQDNGVGLPQGIDLKNPVSLGFQLMEALTTQLGGRLEIKSAGGTRISVWCPAKK